MLSQKINGSKYRRLLRHRDYFINILPLREEHMKTYFEMELNVAQDHRDPSDHMTCLIFSFLALESAKLPTFPDTAK